MSSPWRHALCGFCYDDQNPGRVPVVVDEPELERCCGCAAFTRSGIYWRGDPKPLQCRGHHEPWFAHATIVEMPSEPRRKD